MTDTTQNGAIDTAGDVELVASLFATRAPAIIMTLLFLMVGAVITQAAHDAMLQALIVVGMTASVVRIIVLIAGERAMRRRPLPHRRLRAIERRFAISYLAFAGILGAFCARAIVVAPVEQMVLIGILMTGYAAGVAAGVTLRPRIAITAITIATMPSAIVAATWLGAVGITMAVMLLAFLGGGLRSMQMRYRSETGRIALRRTYEHLARQDYLTQIANRLGLEQHYAASSAAAPGRPIVVHCLDLDGFKQVNDTYGHEVGDALLIAVAARLTDGPGEAIAARLGGDEFVLIEFDTDVADAPRSFHALEQRLSAPYPVDGAILAIGVSIGMATGSTDQPLRDLLREADLRQRLRKLERRRVNHAPSATAPGAPGAPVPAVTAGDTRIAALFL